jgi:hypothetical protein
MAAKLARRHLDESQRAMVGMRLANLKEGRPKKNSANLRSFSQPQAAKLLNFSPRTFADAVKVGQKGTKR